MTLYYGTGAGWFNPWGAIGGYFAWIAYLAMTDANAYPPGSLGNY